MTRPTAIFYAGTNGAGKSSFRERVESQNVEIVIDSDQIAKALHPDNPREKDMSAGKLAIQRFNTAIVERRSFSMETTLTGRSAIRRIREAKQADFQVELRYIGLDNVELNIQRVEERVAKGGHWIDPDLIRKRYIESFSNLLQAVEFTDLTEIYDNTQSAHQLCLTIEQRQILALSKQLPNWVNTVCKQLQALEYKVYFTDDLQADTH